MLDFKVFNFLKNSKLLDFIKYQGFSHYHLHNYISKNLIQWQRLLGGYSYEKKEIFIYKLGSSSLKKAIMWSQMHGNEPFSTYALLLAMEFLQAKNSLSRKILNSIQFFTIPMLNPDGSEKNKRRNAQEIDINRDAIGQRSPEAQILVSLFKKQKPRYCFNLHDQEIYYAPANANRPTIMAFLVPAADEKKTLTSSRSEAMDILGYVVKSFSEYAIAKYNDTYMPTAFGDYFSSNGAVSMLFETGYKIGDESRIFPSLLHAYSIIKALERIATKEKTTNYSKFYNELKFNEKHAFYDYVFKNIVVEDKKKKFIVDIAVNRPRLDPEYFVRPHDSYQIYNIGDLSFKKAFVVKDLKNKLILPKQKIYLYASADWLLDLII